MTRARLIEKVIEGWVERNTDWTIIQEKGVAYPETGRLDYALLAADIDLEFDRIARETTDKPRMGGGHHGQAD